MSLAILGFALLTAVGCLAGDGGGHLTPCYDITTHRLVRLDLDAARDGYVEQRTYLNGNIPFRSEVDADANGRVDRWEYVDDAGAVIKVGGSSRDDGIEDQWIYRSETNGERLVERSSERTPRVDRREFYRGESLARVEEDTNQDGSIDKWETFDGGVLRAVAYDVRRTGRPDRRLFYDSQGKFVRLETDDDGDGRFEVAPAQPAAPLASR